ncbi:hypothetical protein SAY87_018611 [Trapa incisa]|uniref:RING-type domain-containing protein n=1 Tax=Trapa incisa TaxID=236973 RepID=A0AAN7Q5T3_9MYRT|nr:hypothetical protein SAY87_018611 [Trapa incisa]
MAGTLKLEARISLQEDDDEEDYDIILFNIHYENNTQILEIDENEDDSVNVEYENFINENRSKYFNRNQLTDSNMMESIFTSLMDELVPWHWMKDTCEQLVDTAQLVSNRLSNLYEHQFVVNITIKTVTIKFDSENDSNNILHDYFENLLIEKICDYDCKKIYNPYTLESWPLIPFDEIEDDNSCSICFEDYINDNNSVIIITPCSHKYHFKCIFKWLREHVGCPLCRSQIPYTYSMIIIYQPMIYDDY